VFDLECAVSFVIQQGRRLISGFIIVLEEPSRGYLTSTQKSTVTSLHFSQEFKNFNPVGESGRDCPAE
jgi:hypothetical protein